MKTLLRILHIVAITVLIGSAGYAYSTKYETLYYAETLAKTKGKLGREHDAIAVAKAEWALLTRPDRLQKMVDKHLELQPMTISQLGRLADIPARPARDDEITRKLEALGLETGSIGKAGDRPKAAPRSDAIARKLQALDGPAPAGPKGAGTHKPAAVRTAEVKPAVKPAPSKEPASRSSAPKPSAPKPSAPKIPAR